MKLAAILLVTVLTGCAACVPQPPPEPRVIDTSCLWVKELTFSKADTPETKRQIIEHDKALRENCPNNKEQE